MERHCQRGFTLVELLVALSVAAILFGVAIPSFQDLLERQRSWTALNDLRSNLHQARELAVRERTPVTVCRSADGLRCGTGSSWSDGWIVFEARGGTSACTVQASGLCDHGGRVLSVSKGMQGGVYLTANHFVSEQVRFSPEGHAPLSNGTFTACSPDHEVLRGMVLAPSGRVRVARDGENNAC
ncbi:GspH/FimT family pseudopilin [Aquisalimonas sp.]|uniref:GspH/FimT family pseudopilin n=1 Tax=unclassified Aquisalimonas TaxID=2644645 RepID=UPI0025C6E8CB|nr:GspH/FimT family pseudopilin [Aquisalimonas sp.]